MKHITIICGDALRNACGDLAEMSGKKKVIHHFERLFAKTDEFRRQLGLPNADGRVFVAAVDTRDEQRSTICNIAKDHGPT